jgi:hypothetical protein
MSFAGATFESPDDPSASYHLLIQDLDILSKREINSRVIKHVVHTAQALALSSEEPLSVNHVSNIFTLNFSFIDTILTLHWSQIQRVWKMLDAFEVDLQAENRGKAIDYAQ